MPANKLFNYPHNAFLMLRLEFVAICQEEELEAMLLRIIEKHVEIKRQTLFAEAMNKSNVPDDQVVEIPRDLWVPISYRLFMNDLFEIVTSENTIKKALKSLQQKKLIFSRFNPKRRYDAPEYRLHIPVIQSLLDVMFKPGYQSLIPSIIDTLKDLPPQEMTLSGCQELILSCQLRVSKNDPNIRKVTDNNKPNKREEKRDNVTPTSSLPAVSSHTLHSSDNSVSSLAQGGVTIPRPSVKGVSSETSMTPSNAPQNGASSSITKLPIVTHTPTVPLAGASEAPDNAAPLQAESTHAVVTQEDSAPVYGYTNGEKHIDIKQGDFVLTGVSPQEGETPLLRQSTDSAMEEVKITQEILEGWVKGVKGLKLPTGAMRLQNAYDTLLSVVKCEEDVRALYDVARSLFTDGRPIWLGNLANMKVIEKWEETRVETQPLEVIEMPTESTRLALDAKIKADYPMLFTQPVNDENYGIALLIWYGPTGDDYMFVRDTIDWEYWQEDKGMMERAMAYGDYIASQADEILEVVAV